MGAGAGIDPKGVRTTQAKQAVKNGTDQLNGKVDEERQKEADAAADYLEEKGLSAQ